MGNTFSLPSTILFMLSLLVWFPFATSTPTKLDERMSSQVEPTRNILHILISCFGPLSIAVYTAIHLNILPVKSWWRSCWKTFTWIFIAMIAPDWVNWCAIGQREVAQELYDAGRAIETEGTVPWPEEATTKAISVYTPVVEVLISRGLKIMSIGVSFSHSSRLWEDSKSM